MAVMAGCSVQREKEIERDVYTYLDQLVSASSSSPSCCSLHVNTTDGVHDQLSQEMYAM